MTKLIAVLGATGTQGGSVVRTFLKIPGWKVRAVTRNRSSLAAQELVKLGAVLFEADIDNVDSLVSAFSGAHAIFGVTDFWQFPQNPKSQELVKSKGITWNQASYELEVQQGINIIDAAVHGARQGQLERMVLSSLCDTKRASNGKYTWVYHFDSKARFVQYLKQLAQEGPDYRALYEKTSYVQVGYFLDNWRKNPIFKPQKQADGSFEWLHTAESESKNNHPTPFVHPATDTGPFVEALVLKAPAGTTLLGTSSLIPYSKYIQIWDDHNRVTSKVRTITIDELDALFPNGLGREVGEAFVFASEYGWDGGEGAILPMDVGVDLMALTDAETYIKNTDWTSVLA